MLQAFRPIGYQSAPEQSYQQSPSSNFNIPIPVPPPNAHLPPARQRMHPSAESESLAVSTMIGSMNTSAVSPMAGALSPSPLPGQAQQTPQLCM